MATEKVCAKCRVLKPASAFYADSRTKRDGLMGSCKACHAESVAAWQNRNRDRFLSVCSKWKASNKDRQRENLKAWRTRNPEKRRQQDIRKRARHGESIHAMARARTERQKLATPAWANSFIIEEIYDLAYLRSRATGVKHHVDHVVPLNGKTVCGLHVETNLAVIPRRANLLKSNTFSEAA